MMYYVESNNEGLQKSVKELNRIPSLAFGREVSLFPVAREAFKDRAVAGPFRSSTDFELSTC
jgi:hypothetical protein